MVVLRVLHHQKKNQKKTKSALMDEEIVAFMEDMRYITIEDTIKIYKNIN